MGIGQEAHGFRFIDGIFGERDPLMASVGIHVKMCAQSIRRRREPPPCYLALSLEYITGVSVQGFLVRCACLYRLEIFYSFLGRI